MTSGEGGSPPSCRYRSHVAQATASTTPSPTGDYNGNHVVDAADYVVWRKTLNQSAVPQGSGADGNANGTIDAGDYTYWRERFGNAVVGPASAAATVPEPATTVLAAIGLVILTRRFRPARR